MPEPSASDTPQSINQELLLSWSITRPVIDRFMILGHAKVAAISLVIFAGILIFVVATVKPMPSFLAILGIFGVMVGGIVLFTLVNFGIMKLLYRKGMVEVFMLTETSARYSYGRGIQGGWKQLVSVAGPLTGNESAVLALNKERNNQDVPWGAILKYRKYPDDLVITLYHKIAPVMRLYCPNQEIYQQALEIVQQRSAAGGQTDQ